MSLKKLQDYESNDIQVESAIRDAKGQVIHTTYATKGEALSNPMTTQGDLIIGGSSGTPTRLAKGTSGQVLKSTANGLEWANESGGSSGTQLYKHGISITGETGGLQIESLELVLITSSSSPIEDATSLLAISDKLIFGVYNDGDRDYIIISFFITQELPSDLFVISFVAGIMTNVTIETIDDTVTQL